MEKIEGTVETVVFQTDDKAFSVFRIKSPGLGTVTAVYKGQAPFLGEAVALTGSWQEHARFGRQFGVQSYQAMKPSSVKGIERFLGSGAVKGIGKVMAARIVEHFGSATLDILAGEPERLAEVAGIGRKKALVIGAAYADLADLRELMLFLESNGVSGSYAPKLQARYGSTAITRIKANPYDLVNDIEGIGFQTADRIAMAMGLAVDAPERLRAGLGYALIQAASGGHTCVPEEELLKYAARILSVDLAPIEKTFQDLVEQDLLRTVDFGGQRLAYPEYLYRAEVGTAKLLLKLRDQAGSLGRVNPEQIMTSWEEEAGLTLAEAQKEAIRASLKYGVFALTGGPGTGKTTVIKGILAVLERAGCRVLLAAPTGRAAKRLTEAAGRQAQTVHRLLEYNVTGEFGRDEDNPLEAQAIIIDEAFHAGYYFDLAFTFGGGTGLSFDFCRGCGSAAFRRCRICFKRHYPLWSDAGSTA
jgi:exodeoxyribonuclease V alpha subunit